MSHDTLAFALAGLAWVALIYRAPDLVRSWHLPTRRAYSIILASMAAALTVRLGPVERALDRSTDIPNVVRLLENGFILVAIWALQDFLLHMHRPSARGAETGAPSGRPHGHTWLLGGALGTMVVLFVLAPVDEATSDFWVRYADAPFVLEYRVTFLAYVGAGLINLLRLGPRYARRSEDPTVALGLRLCVIGGVIGLAYVGHELSYVVVRRLGGPYALEHVVDPTLLRNVLIAAAVALVLVGSTLPSWGERVHVPALCRWIARYRAYHRLYPLWRDLAGASPGIALLRLPLLDVLTWRRLRFRLYRRVIEIWDGRFAVRPHLETHVTEYARLACHAAKVPPDDEPFIIEAVSLAAGMRAKARGRLAAQPATLPFDHQPSTDKEDLDRDASILSRVAQCYRTSPVVHTVLGNLARLEDEKTLGEEVRHR